MVRRLSVGLAIAVMSIGIAALAADPNVGTWKANIAKSKYSPGPAPKSMTVKIEAWGEDGVKYANDTVAADGTKSHWEFQAKYDGKPYAVKGNPDADMLAYKRIDANTLESTTTLKGKPMQTTRIVMSKDGKTRTLTQTGKDAQGRDINNVVVLEKQ